MRRFTLLAVLLGVMVVPQVSARRIEAWPYERLLKESDVVVIATALPGKDSGTVWKENPWKVNFIGVETPFTIKVILKGKVAGEKLTVLHYRLEPDVLLADGPLLVQFRTKGIKLETKEAKIHLGQPDYLLFLKKRADGKYESVSGQVDPELAVKEMYDPLPEKLGKTDEK